MILGWKCREEKNKIRFEHYSLKTRHMCIDYGVYGVEACVLNEEKNEAHTIRKEAKEKTNKRTIYQLKMQTIKYAMN